MEDFKNNVIEELNKKRKYAIKNIEIMAFDNNIEYETRIKNSVKNILDIVAIDTGIEFCDKLYMTSQPQSKENDVTPDNIVEKPINGGQTHSE